MFPPRPPRPSLADILLQEIVDSSTSNPPTLLQPPTSNSPAPSGATIVAATTGTSTTAASDAQPQQPHTGLDGNIQPVVAAAPPSAAANKIRINITKNVSNKIVINSSENTEKHQHHHHHLNSELNSTETSANHIGDAAGANTHTAAAAAAAAETRPTNSGHDATGDDASQGYDGMHLMTAADAAALQSSEAMMMTASTTAAEPEPEIEFVYKESMRGLRFQVTPTVRNGVDASGLCSIM